MLINLIPHRTRFSTNLHLMTASVLTNINFWKLGNLCMRLTSYNCASHADHLIPHITHFSTTLSLMTVYELTTFKFHG